MTSSLILWEVWQGPTAQYGRASHHKGSLWFQWVVYLPLDKWIWERTQATLNIWFKNEKYVGRGCAGYWKFSSRENMKEEFNLPQKHYNSVWGLNELMWEFYSQCGSLQPFLGQECHQELQRGMGREKISSVHLATSYSAIHQDWCGTHFIFQQKTGVERMRVGGRREEGMVLFCMMRYCHTGSIKAQLLFTAAPWLVKIWSINCCKKPSSAVLNSPTLKENHLQITARKLWTVSVGEFGMKQKIFLFHQSYSKKTLRAKIWGRT